jgi:hypothetical protein
MKITLESTNEIAVCNGLPTRAWQGTTERGTPVVAFVARLATVGDADAADMADMAADLIEAPIETIGEWFARLGLPIPGGEQAPHRLERERCADAAAFRPPPPAPDSLVSRLLDLPEVSGPGVDAHTGGAFLAHAYRGAIMARHALDAHPGEVAAVARMASPVDEPIRSAWLRGFRLVADEQTATDLPDPRLPTAVYDPSFETCPCETIGEHQSGACKRAQS